MGDVVVEKLEQSVWKWRHWWEAEPCEGECWYMSTETVCRWGADYSLQTVSTSPLSLTSCYSSVFSTHIQKVFLTSCILANLGQQPYNVRLNRNSNNWFMLSGITHSCLLPILVETEGSVSLSTQPNYKWVPTSGLQYAAWLHMSTNRRLPGLTVTKLLHTLTHTLPEALRCDSTTEDKGKGSIWPQITAFKKKKNRTMERFCMTAPRSKQHGNGKLANTTQI